MPILQLIIALVISATLSLISISSYQHWREQKALEHSFDLISDQIELARSLNITRGETIYLCASPDLQECNPDWQGAIILFTSPNPPHIDHTLSRIELALSTQLERISNFNDARYLRFMSTGELVYNGTFKIKSIHQQLCFSVNRTGGVKEIACQNQAAAG